MSGKIIKEYVPYLVKHVVKSGGGIPKTEDELIEFCQELSKKIIKKSSAILDN